MWKRCLWAVSLAWAAMAVGVDLPVPPPGMQLVLPPFCAPSPSECRYSCPLRTFISRKEPELCDPNQFETRVACYCLLPETLED